MACVPSMRRHCRHFSWFIDTLPRPFLALVEDGEVLEHLYSETMQRKSLEGNYSLLGPTYIYYFYEGIYHYLSNWKNIQSQCNWMPKVVIRANKSYGAHEQDVLFMNLPSPLLISSLHKLEGQSWIWWLVYEETQFANWWKQTIILYSYYASLSTAVVKTS